MRFLWVWLDDIYDNLFIRARQARSMKDKVQENYNRIKDEVEQIMKDELERIASDESLKHPLQNE